MELLGDFSLPFTLHIFALGRISLFARGHIIFGKDRFWERKKFCKLAKAF